MLEESTWPVQVSWQAKRCSGTALLRVIRSQEAFLSCAAPGPAY